MIIFGQIIHDLLDTTGDKKKSSNFALGPEKTRHLA
jgi:hypothetical protein